MNRWWNFVSSTRSTWEIAKAYYYYFLQWPISKRLAPLNLTLTPCVIFVSDSINKSFIFLFVYWFRFSFFVTNLIGGGFLFPFFSFVSIDWARWTVQFNIQNPISTFYERCVWARVPELIILLLLSIIIVFGWIIDACWVWRSPPSRKPRAEIRIWLLDHALPSRNNCAEHLSWERFYLFHKSQQVRRDFSRLM